MGITKRVRVCKLCVRLYSKCSSGFVQNIIHIAPSTSKDISSFPIFAQSRLCSSIHVCRNGYYAGLILFRIIVYIQTNEETILEKMLVHMGISWWLPCGFRMKWHPPVIHAIWAFPFFIDVTTAVYVVVCIVNVVVRKKKYLLYIF